MKRVLGIAAAATLALSVAAIAQETKKPAAEHTMTGCRAEGRDRQLGRRAEHG